MTAEFRERINNKIIRPFAKQSLRTLLLAYKDLETKTKHIDYESVSEDFLEDELIFVGVVGIKDPLRKEIPSAIKKCKEASITVRMVTGDNLETAMAISKDAGIIEKDYEHTKGSYVVMEGKDFREQVANLF
jgi:Ca2+ transporting ATPase